MYQLFLPVTTVKETAVMLLVQDVKKRSPVRTQAMTALNYEEI
jgi:hypothetical protein